MNKTGIERIFEGGISYRNQVHVKKDKYRFLKILMVFTVISCLIFVGLVVTSPAFIDGLVRVLEL